MRSLLFTLAALIAVGSAQQRSVDPRNAAILQEARYLSGDGSFGSAYVQEDGVEFKEETDADGNRKGSYSYVDPNGKLTVVNYTAGKNGFQVTGDHLPKAPVAPAPQPQYQPAPKYRQPQQAPPPQYNPAPQYNTVPTQNQQYQYNNNNVNQYQQQPQYNQFAPQQQYNFPTTTTTTPSPRFFPPGKLNLNRTPDGYQYSFSSN